MNIGRYTQKRNWGTLLSPKISWIVMESPNIWLSLLNLYFALYKFPDRLMKSFPIHNLPNKILLSCFLIHYIHRTLIFPFKLKKGSAPMPFLVVLFAFLFCLWNSANTSLSLIFIQQFDENWVYHPQFISGFLLFWFGLIVNIQSDNILLNLRKNEGTKEYKIPYGGFFEYVSCANYCKLIFSHINQSNDDFPIVGEIVEWTGFALACNSLPAYAFMIYTFCNIGPRGYKHHLWYLQKFEDYPKNRTAVIPFIF